MARSPRRPSSSAEAATGSTRPSSLGRRPEGCRTLASSSTRTGRTGAPSPTGASAGTWSHFWCPIGTPRETRPHLRPQSESRERVRATASRAARPGSDPWRRDLQASPSSASATARWATLAAFGTVRSAVLEPAPNGGRLQMELRPNNVELPPDSDTALVTAGYVAVTTITGIQATAPVDVDGIVGQLFGEGRRSA